jgi:hypothetical protein
VHGWYSVDERAAGVHKGEDERALAEEHGSPNSDGHGAATGEIPQQITAAVEAGEDS